MTVLNDVFGVEKPVLGMVHLEALPGSPLYNGNLDKVLESALRDARSLKKSGANAVIIENFNDYPFYPDTMEPETVASLTMIAHEIRKEVDLPMGINILRNSWKAALAVAGVVGAEFIRLNILTDAYITDQGFINAEAHLVMRYRKHLGLEHVKVFADIQTKHAAPIAPRPLGVLARDTAYRGMADALILAGEESADPPTVENLKAVREAVPDVPIIIGSGMKVETANLLKYADGAVFGYGSKIDDIMTNPVDEDKTRRFCEGVDRERQNSNKVTV
ncbi:BtpA/SgcQ family protein [Oceanobacillus sp. CF4.6]|uniref:BtpA/SgcQ family protein n=1 Tax=Oceanobacillus sp. CF4.6 TaxID=3373080 RepID=UPI003EE6707B